MNIEGTRLVFYLDLLGFFFLFLSAGLKFYREDYFGDLLRNMQESEKQENLELIHRYNFLINLIKIYEAILLSFPLLICVIMPIVMIISLINV